MDDGREDADPPRRLRVIKLLMHNVRFWTPAPFCSVLVSFGGDFFTEGNEARIEFSTEDSEGSVGDVGRRQWPGDFFERLDLLKFT
jgi:hypothetical protein